MKIPIKKTNRKVPKSRYRVFVYSSYLTQEWAKDTIEEWGTYPIVTDISKGLENPIRCENTADTIRDLFDDMKSPSYFVVNKEQAKKIKQYNKAIKPSLWQRIKRKVGR